MPAGVDDERLRRQQCFNVVELQRVRWTLRNELRCGQIEDAGSIFDFSHERRDTGFRAQRSWPALVRRVRP